MHFVYTATYIDALDYIDDRAGDRQVAVAELENGVILHYTVTNAFVPPLSQAARSIGAGEYTACSPVWISRADNEPLDVATYHGDPQRFVDSVKRGTAVCKSTASAAAVPSDIDAKLQARLDELKQDVRRTVPVGIPLVRLVFEQPARTTRPDVVDASLGTSGGNSDSDVCSD